MKRLVFSFPTAVATFLLGVSAFLFIAWLGRQLATLPTLDAPAKFEVSSHDPKPLAERSTIADTKEIYDVILTMDLYRSKKIVIEEFTERGGLMMDDAVATRAIVGADTSSIENYELRNETSSSLREAFRGRSDIVFFTKKDAKDFERDKDTPFETNFERRFPGSHRIVSLSNIGFSADGSHALIYVSYYCGGLCAGGSFIILEKTNNKWSITSEDQMWVS